MAARGHTCDQLFVTASRVVPSTGLSGTAAVVGRARLGRCPPGAGVPGKDGSKDAAAFGAAVYNWAIWLIALLPVANVLLELAWKPTLSYRTVVTGGQSIRMLELGSVFTPMYFLLLLAGLIAYALCLWSAYVDWKKLAGEGVVRPFHWTWAFLAPAVYVVGRSLVVRKVALPLGLAPIWALIATAALAVIVAVIKAAEMFPGANSIPT